MVLKLTLKIKPRDQLWEKKGHSATFLMSKTWAKCTKYFLRSPQMVLLMPHPTFFNIQTFLCVKNLPPFVLTTATLLLDVLQPQEYTWDKGQHLLLMIKMADWNIVNRLLSPQPVLFKIKKILAFLFPPDCALLSWFEQLVHTCYLLWQKCIFHICADQRYRDMQHRWITCPCLADRTHFSLIIPDENVNISRNQSLMEASWQEQLKWYVG